MNPASIAATLSAAGATLFERGWLSSNNLLIQGGGHSALIDSGYHSHSQQTLLLVERALEGRPLDVLLNTHLHSDHCGGNAALQARFPGLQTLIPPGQAPAVAVWDEDALTYRATGQHCPRFRFSGLLRPGSIVRLGAHDWEVHGAKGHDPHSVILFEPRLRLLISADALWQNGFGVVFPELDGIGAFDEVSDTLDLIERLAPTTVVPGHGAAFQDVQEALKRARDRLAKFKAPDDRHLRYALKVLIKFRLLEWQQIELEALEHWAADTPYMRRFMPASVAARRSWLHDLLTELEQANALKRVGATVHNL